MLAPSSHNRQPWQVDLREPDAITLHVDRERLLPETDPWFRQIVVSQGTFLELLVIALRERGIEPSVALFPDGEFAARGVDDRPVARISWSGPAPAATKDPLFGQILRRHTAKVDYDRERAGRAGDCWTGWPARCRPAPACASAAPSIRPGCRRCASSARTPRSSSSARRAP